MLEHQNTNRDDRTLPGTTPARAPTSCRHCRRQRGRPCRRALPGLRDARVRVLAVLAAAGPAAAARLTALARSARHRRRILAAAGALGPNAGLANTDVRLSGHEKLLFWVDVMSTKRSLSSRRIAGIGWSSYCR